MSYLDIFQWDYSFGNIFRGVLEVVEASVTQDEPASFPTFPAVKKREKNLKLFCQFQSQMAIYSQRWLKMAKDMLNVVKDGQRYHR